MLDEQLDRRLKRFFGEEYEVVTVQETPLPFVVCEPLD